MTGKPSSDRTLYDCCLGLVLQATCKLSQTSPAAFQHAFWHLPEQPNSTLLNAPINSAIAVCLLQLELPQILCQEDS